MRDIRARGTRLTGLAPAIGTGCELVLLLSDIECRQGDTLSILSHHCCGMLVILPAAAVHPTEDASRSCRSRASHVKVFYRPFLLVSHVAPSYAASLATP